MSLKRGGEAVRPPHDMNEDRHPLHQRLYWASARARALVFQSQPPEPNSRSILVFFFFFFFFFFFRLQLERCIDCVVDARRGEAQVEAAQPGACRALAARVEPQRPRVPRAGARADAEEGHT